MTRFTQTKERHRGHRNRIGRGVITTGLALAALLLFAPAVRGQATAEGDTSPIPNQTRVDLVPPYLTGAPLSSWWHRIDAREATRAESPAVRNDAKEADALWDEAVRHLYSGERTAAYADFRRAAEAARKDGNVYLAARANLRAAYVANALDNPADALQAMERVRELRDSPRLTEDQRKRLMVEVEHPYVG